MATKLIYRVKFTGDVAAADKWCQKNIGHGAVAYLSISNWRQLPWREQQKWRRYYQNGKPGKFYWRRDEELGNWARERRIARVAEEIELSDGRSIWHEKMTGYYEYAFKSNEMRTWFILSNRNTTEKYGTVNDY